MKQQLSVIKIGGNVIDDPASLAIFLEHFAAIEGYKILIHGGGKLATTMAKEMSIPQQLIDGRRITDEATLKIVTMVYAGIINKNIVAQLLATGCTAIGLSGVDGNLILAHKRANDPYDYGFVGDIDAINTSLIQCILKSGASLVVAPITHDNKGQLLNTNADTIAQEIAQAMGSMYKTQLIYCFEKNGVLKDVTDEESYIPSIHPGIFEKLIAEGAVSDGMLPKLHNAFAALEKGVSSVTIGKWTQLHCLISGTSGTKISNE